MSEGDNNKTAQEQNKSAGQVRWGEVAKGGGNSGQPRSLWNQVEKLKLKDPSTQYRIRLIGDPYRFFKLYEPIEITLDPVYNQELEVFKAGNHPSSRYGVWVFDRNDGNKIKLFEGGPMVFRQFGNYQEIIGKDPGGPLGPDWSVSFTDPIGENGKKNPRLRQYRCMHIESIPFTEEENRRIAEHIAKFPYDQVVKGSDDEYIGKLWEEAKNAPADAPIPGSYIWYQQKRDNREDTQQASRDLNLDAPKGAQQTAAPAAPPVNTGASGDGFNETFKTGAPAQSGEGGGGGTALF